MTTIHAGNTLAIQYAPPFVITDAVTTNWQLRYNVNLLAFEAFDPSENVTAAGFDSIESILFPGVVSQQVFVVPWAVDTTQTNPKASLYVTIQGVKQHTGTYTILVDLPSNTTTITLGGPANDDVEFIGLQTTGGATVELANATANGTDVTMDLNWLAPSEQSLLITLDGIKQDTSAYAIASNATFTGTTITFTEAPSVYFVAVTSIDNGGTGYIAGNILTIADGAGAGTIAGTITVDTEAGGVITGATLNNTGSYSVLPTNPVSVTGGSGGDDATFSLSSTGQEIEVVGITTTGETPASPIDAANLSGGVNIPGTPTVGYARLYSHKTVAGENQILNIRGLFAGTGITLSEIEINGMTGVANSVQIDAAIPVFQNYGTGQGIIVDPNADPLQFHVINAGNRIIISLAAGTTGLTWAYDDGYKTIGLGGVTVNADTGDRIIPITNTGAPVTVNLLAIAELPAGDTITIKDQTGGASANNITVTPASEFIDGAATHVINTNYGYVTLYSDGTNYFIIAEG